MSQKKYKYIIDNFINNLMYINLMCVNKNIYERAPN